MVSNEDRTKAQDIFLQFQHTKGPFDLCREILETSTNNFVLYQVGGCLKNAIVREWDTFNPEKATALFVYLFEYVNHKPTERYVVEQLMFINSLIVKRLVISEPDKHHDKPLIDRLFDISKNTSLDMSIRLNACITIDLIINEFNTFGSQSSTGISWYNQLMAEQHFEKHRFADILKRAVSVLYEHLRQPEEVRITVPWIKLALKLTQLCLSIFNWKCSNTSYSTFASIFQRNPRFIANLAEWIAFSIDSIGFFFEVYITFRKMGHDILMHNSLQCLVQLGATLSVYLRGSKVDTKKKFCEQFMQNIVNFLNMISYSISVAEQEFLANVINSICNQMRSQIVQHAERQIINQFLEIMSKLTINTIHESVRFLNEKDEDAADKCNYAIGQLLGSWLIIQNIVECNSLPVHPTSDMGQQQQDSSFITKQDLVTLTRPIVENYLRAHLCKPEGLIESATYLDDDDIQEFEEEDFSRFREQLEAIGTLAQPDAQYSIDLFSRLLVLKLKQLEACVGGDRANFAAKHTEWVCACEDIHWLLMTAINLFTLTTEKDSPPDLLILSRECGADALKTQQALAAADYTVEGIDPVVRYFIVVLNLVNMEKCLLQRGLTDMISPQVSRTLSLFLHHFCDVYLLPPEFDNEEMSLNFNTCFGADSPTAVKLVDFFLDHLLVKFIYLSSESFVLTEAANGLSIFAKFKDRLAVIQKSNGLRVLLDKFSKDQLPNLCGSVRKCMYDVFIKVYAGNLDLVLTPLIELYQRFIHSLKANGDKEFVREQFIKIGECTQGVISGLSEKAFAQTWETFLLPLFHDLPNVMAVLHTSSPVVQTILELLLSYSYGLCSFVSDSQSMTFYNIAVNILAEYAKHVHAGGVTTTSAAAADESRAEEMVQEFELILKVLNELSIQDVVFIFTNSNASTSLGEVIGQMVLTCLNIIMPMVTPKLLENERLCELYYKLLDYISQDFDRFSGFPPKLLDSFLQSVKYVFTQPK